MMRKLIAAVALTLTLAVAGSAQAQFLIMPDSTNNRTVLFDPFDGSLVNSNYFALSGGTPIHAMQVGSEIWVSTQIGDRIDRFSLTGSPLGSITGSLDNLRGMALINNTVYLCNDGTGNGAPGPSLQMFDTSGNSLGFFLTPGVTGPFGILEYNGNLLVSSDAANDDIHQYSLTGTPLGTFHNSSSLNFAEQMNYAANGDILVAGFSSNNIARLDATNGGLISTYSASGARGVWQLGNGNILWTNSAGAHVLDVNTGLSSLVYAGGGRFIDFVVIPAPGAMSLLCAAGLFGVRRRRR